MAKEIHGIVQQNPIILEECCIFAVEQQGNYYLVLSLDRQANKDHIFVEQGQEICIRGSTLEDIDFKGLLISEQAQIIIGKDVIEKKKSD